MRIHPEQIQPFTVEAAVDPTPSDDGVSGFSRGATWLNTTTQRAFLCVDDTTGLAVWREVTASASADFDDILVSDNTGHVLTSDNLGNVLVTG